MKVTCALALVIGIVGASMANAGEPRKAATSDLPAALQMVGISQDSVVSRDAAHKVRGQLFLGDAFDFSQSKTFGVTGAIAKGTTNLLEGVTGNYQYSLTETAGTPALPAGVTKTITLLVDGQFAGLGGGIGVNNNTADTTNFGSLNFVVGGKFLNEALEFQGGTFSQTFQQNFSFIPPPPAVP
jgi:hypothetical protein